MLYTPSHAELAQHPKTRKLARRLGVSIPTAIGHLHLLWHFALKYAPDGDLSRFDGDEIADGCLWEGEPTTLGAALVDAGWLEEDGTIHDWHEYGGKALKQKEDNAKRQQAWRDRHKTVSQPSPNKPVTVTSPLDNALDKKRIDQKKEEETIPPLIPPRGSGGGGADAPRQVRPTRPVPKPKDDPATKENPWWDALVAGIGVTPTTPDERSLYGKAVRDLRALDAEPNEILRRCANYRARFPNAELTCTALLKHWSRCEHPPPEPTPLPSRNGRRPTVEDANLALEERYKQQENGHEPSAFPEAIDVDWHSNEQGANPRPLRPVVGQVRRAP